MRLDLCAFGRRLVVDYDRADAWADDEAATSPIGNTACDFEIAYDEERPIIYPADPDLGSFGFAPRRW